SSGTNVTLAFTLDEPTGYEFAGSLFVDSPAAVTASASTYLYRIVDQRAEYVFVEDVMQGTRGLSYAGVLEPGEYRFFVGYSLGFTALGPASLSAAASYDVTLTVPAPGALGLVGAGAVVAARRRRDQGSC